MDREPSDEATLGEWEAARGAVRRTHADRAVRTTEADRALLDKIFTAARAEEKAEREAAAYRRDSDGLYASAATSSGSLYPSPSVYGTDTSSSYPPSYVTTTGSTATVAPPEGPAPIPPSKPWSDKQLAQFRIEAMRSACYLHRTAGVAQAVGPASPAPGSYVAPTTATAVFPFVAEGSILATMRLLLKALEEG